jgi:DNA-binding GntR family transcriptional regulator
MQMSLEDWPGDGTVNASLKGAAPRLLLGEVVAQRVREAILRNDLKPGQHLREEELAELLDVSRGPVRDAFLLLEREGLVTLSRHRGASVVDLSPSDLGEVYSLRSAIEELAVRLAIRRHTDGDLAALESAMRRIQVGASGEINEDEAARLDVEFHDMIFSAAHHVRLQAAWTAIRMQVYWFLLRRKVAKPDWRTMTIESHQRILDLIYTGDEDAAVVELHHHIKGAYRRIVDRMQEDEDRSRVDAQAGKDAETLAQSYLLS